jgi:soluble lytic murein transglycosylase-like protein
MESAFRGHAHTAVIEGTQGLHAASGDRRQAVLFGEFRRIPLRREGIGQDRDSQKRIAAGRADQDHAARGLADCCDDLLQKSMRARRKQGLVAAHAGAASPEHKTCSSHEMMVPSEIASASNWSWSLAFGNKMMYICFILALVMLAASPMRAAEAESNASPQSFKTVVKVDPRTGKLVRTQVALHPPTAPAAIPDLVQKASRAHNVDPLLVDSVIRVESNYNPNAISPKGAEGLMQLMPPTARMLGVNDSFDPAENIEAGVKYLKYLQDLYKDDRLALAAYNAGPAAVDRFKQVPPYPETRKYVENVGKKYGEARNAAAQKAGSEKAAPNAAGPATPALTPPVQAPAPVPVQVEEEKHPKLEQFVDADGRLHLRTSP